LAIANGIKEIHPDAEILFVGAQGRMEMQKVPEAGYSIEGLWISGIQRKLTIDNLSFPLKVISSVRNSLKILKRFQPDAVVGVGGYASGPLLYAASMKKIPSLIQEQNSYAGLTNKILAGKASKICVAYEGMEKFFPKQKIVLTGNPVRKDIMETDSKREQALKHFNLSADKKTILVIGGSLGARTINQSILAHIQQIIDSGHQMIWQIGKFYFKDLQTQLEGKDLSNIRPMEFVREMDLAYAAADVVISRAGALSISELCLVKRPVIFVPSPNVSEDHQTKNAMALVNKDAAIMVKDLEAKEKLVDEVMNLLKNESRQIELSQNIGKMAMPDATKRIVEEVLKLVKK
jgi:UDP-N-acetylglucosamine--N-acetylmuramyl-(pentapeptide) pyrophosphoryl-undecaprenol N-acetylglucosamine transferase